MLGYHRQVFTMSHTIKHGVNAETLLVITNSSRCILILSTFMTLSLTDVHTRLKAPWTTKFRAAIEEYDATNDMACTAEPRKF